MRNKQVSYGYLAPQDSSKLGNQQVPWINSVQSVLNQAKHFRQLMEGCAALDRWQVGVVLRSMDEGVKASQKIKPTLTSSMPRGGGGMPKASMMGKSILLGYTIIISITSCTATKNNNLNWERGEETEWKWSRQMKREEDTATLKWSVQV